MICALLTLKYYFIYHFTDVKLLKKIVHVVSPAFCTDCLFDTEIVGATHFSVTALVCSALRTFASLAKRLCRRCKVLLTLTVFFFLIIALVLLYSHTDRCQNVHHSQPFFVRGSKSLNFLNPLNPGGRSQAAQPMWDNIKLGI